MQIVTFIMKPTLHGICEALKSFCVSPSFLSDFAQILWDGPAQRQ